MTKVKRTKKALLVSMLSMLLCCAMLVGSTFAWFTDSVTSGKNKIVAGNLDVELYHTNAHGENEKVSTTEDELFTDVNGDPILWEPGAAAFETFKVANEGTLALKFELALETADANTVVGADDRDTKKTIADVLKIAVIDDGSEYDTRDEMLAAVKEHAVTLNEYVSGDKVLSGKLLPKNATLPTPSDEWKSESQTFTVVLYWEPGPDDDLYNLKNGAYASDADADSRPGELKISLAVTLLAAQVPFESDSFNDQYDNKPFMTYEKMAAQKEADEAAYKENKPFRIGEGEEAEYYDKMNGKRQADFLEMLQGDGTPAVLTGDFELKSTGTEGYKGIEGKAEENGIYRVDLNGHTATSNWIFMRAKDPNGAGYDFELRNGTMQSYFSHYCDVDVYGAKKVLLEDLILGTFRNGDWQDKDDNFAEAGKDSWGPQGNYGSGSTQVNGYCSPIKIFMNETSNGEIVIRNVETHGGANRIKAYKDKILIDGCEFIGSKGKVTVSGSYKADPEALYITGADGTSVDIRNTTVTNKQVRLENAGKVTITSSDLLAGLKIEGYTQVTLVGCTLTNKENTEPNKYPAIDINSGSVTIVSGTYSFDPSNTHNVHLAEGSTAVHEGDVWIVTASK